LFTFIGLIVLGFIRPVNMEKISSFDRQRHKKAPGFYAGCLMWVLSLSVSKRLFG